MHEDSHQCYIKAICSNNVVGDPRDGMKWDDFISFHWVQEEDEGWRRWDTESPESRGCFIIQYEATVASAYCHMLFRERTVVGCRVCVCVCIVRVSGQRHTSLAPKWSEQAPARQPVFSQILAAYPVWEPVSRVHPWNWIFWTPVIHSYSNFSFNNFTHIIMVLVNMLPTYDQILCRARAVCVLWYCQCFYVWLRCSSFY